MAFDSELYQQMIRLLYVNRSREASSGSQQMYPMTVQPFKGRVSADIWGL